MFHKIFFPSKGFLACLTSKSDLFMHFFYVPILPSFMKKSFFTQRTFRFVVLVNTTGWTESKFVNSFANNFVNFWFRHLGSLSKKCPYDGTFWLSHSWKMAIFLGFEPLTHTMTTFWRSKFDPQELQSGVRILKET